MKEGPYKHWEEGTIVITIHKVGCNGKTPADAKRKLKQIGKSMEKLIRDYWLVGPYAKGFSMEIKEISEEGPKS